MWLGVFNVLAIRSLLIQDFSLHRSRVVFDSLQPWKQGDERECTKATQTHRSGERGRLLFWRWIIILCTPTCPPSPPSYTSESKRINNKHLKRSLQAHAGFTDLTAFQPVFLFRPVPCCVCSQMCSTPDVLMKCEKWSRGMSRPFHPQLPGVWGYKKTELTHTGARHTERVCTHTHIRMKNVHTFCLILKGLILEKPG